MRFSIKSSIGTFGLIVVNIIVFVIFGFTSSPENDAQVLGCLKQNHPECVAVSSIDDFSKCAVANPHGNPDFCIYNIKKTCLNSQKVLHDCFPREAEVTQNLSFVPALFGQGKNLYTLMTSMFMHVGWAHLLSNMIFLFLTGIFIEKRLGTVKFLIFYLLVGICSTLFYYVFNESSEVALLGASGAIFGLMGANLILDFFKPGPDDMGTPYFKVQTLVLMIFYQFVFQMFDPGGAIAYLGHIGGFIAGVTLIFYFKKKYDVYTPTPSY
ncbi:MAG: rhomboid family intramembrane serine protease [Candidatus Taylorbacteria bacterium]